MATCTKITFDMMDEKTGEKWTSVFEVEKENVIDLSMSSSFLPDSGGEELILRIVRITRYSQEYGAYIKSGMIWGR